MYTSQILQYLIWPAFIILCWYLIKAALYYYERSSGENKDAAGKSSGGLKGNREDQLK